ncbi:hypothetical protein [Sinomonas sp. G460-2]|uniref:hypothetical protein n=1 Tax=Sinomonas sp. G460-2 TaxID=3393464 RepID=UPI0039F121BD
MTQQIDAATRQLPGRRVLAWNGHPELLQKALDTAERELISEAARGRNRGILMTRLDTTTFMAELSDEVPYGSTWERDLS